MEELTHHPRRLLLVSCVAESCDLKSYGHSHGEPRIRNKHPSSPPHTEWERQVPFVEDQLKVNRSSIENPISIYCNSSGYIPLRFCVYL